MEDKVKIQTFRVLKQGVLNRFDNLSQSEKKGRRKKEGVGRKKRKVTQR